MVIEGTTTLPLQRSRMPFIRKRAPEKGQLSYSVMVPPMPMCCSIQRSGRLDLGALTVHAVALDLKNDECTDIRNGIRFMSAGLCNGSICYHSYGFVWGEVSGAQFQHPSRR